MTRIDTTASVDPGAELDHGVEVGPFCVVGPEVVLGRGTQLIGHVSIRGIVTMGEHNTVGRFTAIGCEPQDTSYKGTPTRVIMGDHNEIRDNVTISRGTDKEIGVTRIGDHNILASGSHVAHDCILGDGVHLGAKVLLAGHVRIESYAMMADGSVALQFVTVGGFSMAMPLAKVGRDLPPFMVARGNPAEVCGLNAGALRSHEMGKDKVTALRLAHRLLYTDRVDLLKAEDALKAVQQITPAVRRLLDFLHAQRAGKLGRARGR